MLMGRKEKFTGTIQIEESSFGGVKMDKTFLSLVNNRLVVILEIICQTELTNLADLPGVNSCVVHTDTEERLMNSEGSLIKIRFQDRGNYIERSRSVAVQDKIHFVF